MTTLAQQRLVPADALSFAAISLGMITVAIAAVTGGMPVLIMALAAGLAIHVFKHPDNAIVAGPVFLMACNAFLPSSARFDFLDDIWQMYFWAAGILLITAAALAGVGWKGLTQLPRSLQALIAVALAATIYGLARGNGPSYVLRQLFGTLLFVSYFALARYKGDETAFLQKTKIYGIPCVLAFVIYYVWVFGEFGIHKEISTLGTQASILAILYVARGGRKWWSAAGTMLLAPLLLVERRALVAFGLGLVLIVALKAKSTLWKTAAWGLALSITAISLLPPLAGGALDAVIGTSAGDELLPAGARDTSSVEDRGLQLGEAVLVVAHSPVFGNGLGSELEWQSVVRGSFQQTYVDNGWAYILTKMGLAGAVTFGWFIFELCGRMRHGSVGLTASLLSMLLLVMFAEPVFFQFTTSPFLGAIAGLLWSRKKPPLTNCQKDVSYYTPVSS